MKPILGYVECPQGGRAEVRQTTKRGRHFYTRCECCGLNQGTGAKRQQHIWDSAEWLPDAVVVRPVNVEDSGRLPVNESELPELPELKTETETETETETCDYELGEFEEAESEAEEKTGGGLKRGALALGVTFVAGVAACLMS